MQKKRLLAVPALVVLLCSLDVAAAEQWFSYRSEHFEGIGNGPKGRSRKLIAELEQFRQVMVELFDLQSLDRVPVTVVLFKSDKSFRPFQPRYEGKPRSIAGFFRQSGERNFIALNVNSRGNPLETIYHEYVHLMTGESPYPLPLWLLEGLAEFYSTFEVAGDKVHVGKAIRYHLELLISKNLMPLEAFFQVTHGSPEYNEKSKTGIFYAQSWALAHWLMLGDEAVRQPKLGTFIRKLAAGEEAIPAFEDSLGMTIEEVEKDLRSYIRDRSFYYATSRLEDFEVQTRIEVEPLEEAEAEIRLGDLQLAGNRIDEAAARYEAAARLAPDSPRVHEAKGLLALRKGDSEEALRHLAAAAERGSANYLVHYHLAEMVLEDAVELNPAEVPTLRARIARAIELAPGFAPAHHLQGRLSLMSGQDLEGGIAAVQQAVRLKPQEAYYRVTLAELFLKQDNRDSARAVLEGLKRDGDSSYGRYAEGQLDYLDFLDRREREAKAFEEKRARNRDPDGPLPPEAPDPRAEAAPDVPDPAAEPRPEPVHEPELPTCRPAFASIHGRPPIQGRLTHMECSGPQPVFLVEIEGQVERLVGADPEQFPLFSCQAGVAVQCGPLQGEAIVYFVPGHERDDEAKAFKIIALEFRPR